jgi:hypothetical protein
MIDIFASTGCRRVPVVHNGQLQRILSRSDLLDWFVRHIGAFHQFRHCQVGRLAVCKYNYHTLSIILISTCHVM